MSEESSSGGLSRRAFLLRFGGRSLSEEDRESDQAEEVEAENGKQETEDSTEEERVLSPEEARRQLERLGVSVMPLSEEDDLLQIQCTRVGTQFGPEQMRLLEPLVPRIAWLNLARTSIDDEALGVVADMAELQRLYLEHTKVEGPGLSSLTDLDALEYLNLFGTHVGDEALDHLVELDGLQTVYLMQTEVSEEGVESLKERRPNLSVEFGDPFF